jgi:hypothetical protein
LLESRETGDLCLKLAQIIHDHAPEGLTVTERNLAEEIDQVVKQTLARRGTTPTLAAEASAAPPPQSSAGTC